MKIINEVNLSFTASGVNEWFARSAISAFILPFDPTVEELSDIKTAVSEAVTNCIVHGYKMKKGIVYITAKITDTNKLIIKVRDKGCGIDDIEKAMEPMFTTAVDERAGLGFAVMQSFTDNLKVSSKPGKGTTVTMEKTFRKHYLYESKR